MYQWEQNLLRLVPAYTLETLAECDIDALLPFYFAVMNSKDSTETSEPVQSDIVYRDGKPYKVTTAAQADWVKNIF